ncbi:MAG TPA: pyruvate, phosphate dikinase [Candidatus Dormibacteraeota bacterium]|nr:pyruvate, phosphate dikinase [Candidatus Dormibacteraeota bacterium]
MSELLHVGNGARSGALEAERFVLAFGEADHRQVRLLGGKGAGLARLTAEGFPAPPGFIITTDACRSVTATGTVPAGLFTEVLEHLTTLERHTGKSFGAGPSPLLLSVRSGAPVSMPGMMDTVLNLGINRETAVAIAEASGDRRFMADVLVRFHRMYSEIVLGGSGEAVAEAAHELVEHAGPRDAAELHDELWAACQRAVLDEVGEEVPAEPREQLRGAIEAVFRSWNNRRAVTYRDFHRIPHDLGTAVVVQSMVFGNLGSPSGSGVVFTRNPVTGDPQLYGEYLEGGQGEDVVAGTATPEQIAYAARRLPVLFDELRSQCGRLEALYGDVLDIEFTVERGRLYLLQVRSAKRTPEAAIRIAADFLREARLPRSDALAPVTAAQIRQLERPQFADGAVSAARAAGRLLTTGVGASPGQVSGTLVLDPDRAVKRVVHGEEVILARPITSPVDLHGMIASRGIVTATGGATSHAAVVARALAKPCVVGCGEATIEPDQGRLSVGGRVIAEGETISIDGLSGEVFAGALPMTAPAAANPDLSLLLGEADRLAGCRIMGRVTTPEHVATVLDRGATGVVTSVDDVLATTGHLNELIDSLLAQRDLDTLDLTRMEAGIAEVFEPILRAAGAAEVGVRAIDFQADEARELMQQTQLLTFYPQLSVPVGMPALLRAQLAGLITAAKRSGGGGRVHLAVRHVSDPREARALRELSRQAEGRVQVGTYLTSPRGALLSAGIAEESDVIWLEVRVMQAAMFGIPPRQLLTQRPLDDYVKRGLIDTDPRHAIDPTLHGILTAVATAAAEHPRCEVGMRLSGPVSEEIAATLYRIGFRLFAVDGDEVRPARLAFGKAPSTEPAASGVA